RLRARTLSDHVTALRCGSDAGLASSRSRRNSKPAAAPRWRVRRNRRIIRPAEQFIRFYSTLASTQGPQHALIRSDGRFLARYPQIALEHTQSLDETTNSRRTMTAHPRGGLYRSRSPLRYRSELHSSTAWLATSLLKC